MIFPALHSLTRDYISSLLHFLPVLYHLLLLLCLLFCRFLALSYPLALHMYLSPALHVLLPYLLTEVLFNSSVPTLPTLEIILDSSKEIWNLSFRFSSYTPF